MRNFIGHFDGPDGARTFPITARRFADAYEQAQGLAKTGEVVRGVTETDAATDTNPEEDE